MMDFIPSNRRRVNSTNSSGRSKQLDSLPISAAHVKDIASELSMNCVLMKWINGAGKHPDHDFGTRPQCNSSSALLSADYQSALDLQRNMSGQRQHLGSDVHVERISQFNSSRSQSGMGAMTSDIYVNPMGITRQRGVDQNSGLMEQNMQRIEDNFLLTDTSPLYDDNDDRNQRFSTMRQAEMYENQQKATEICLDLQTSRFSDVTNSDLGQRNRLLDTQRMRSSQVLEGEANDWQGCSMDQQWSRELNNSVYMDRDQQWGRQPNVSVDMDREQQWGGQPNISVDMDREQQWDGSGEYTETVDSQRQYFGDVRDSMDSGREQFDYTDGVSSSWGQIRSGVPPGYRDYSHEKGLQTGVLSGTRDYSQERGLQTAVLAGNRNYSHERGLQTAVLAGIRDYSYEGGLQTGALPGNRDYSHEKGLQTRVVPSNRNYSHERGLQTGTLPDNRDYSHERGLQTGTLPDNRDYSHERGLQTEVLPGFKDYSHESIFGRNGEDEQNYGTRFSDMDEISSTGILVDSHPRGYMLNRTEQHERYVNFSTRGNDENSRDERLPNKSLEISLDSWSTDRRPQRSTATSADWRSEHRRSPVSSADRSRSYSSDRRYPSYSQGRLSGRRSPIHSSTRRSPVRHRSPLRTAERSQRDSRVSSSRHSERRRSPLWTSGQRSNTKSADRSSVQQNKQTESEPSQTESQPNQQETVPVTFVEDMMCPACLDSEKLYKTFEMLKNHWKNMHSRSKLCFSCPVHLCLESVPSKTKLIDHVRDVHNNGEDLKHDLETFLQEEIEGFSIEWKPKIDPGILTLDLCEDQPKGKKSALTKEAAIVHILLNSLKPSLPTSKTSPLATESPSFSVLGRGGIQEKTKASPTPTSTALAAPPAYQNVFHGGPSGFYPLSDQAQTQQLTHLMFQPGMVCPICPSSEPHLNVDDFRTHWYMYHVRSFERLVCPRIGCTTAAGSVAILTKHYKNEHNDGNDLTEGIKDLLNNVKGGRLHNNNNFMDPGCFRFDLENTEEEVKQGKAISILFQPHMRCPVCRARRRFQSELDFKKHWLHRHVQFHDRYACPFDGCNSSTGSLESLRSHYRTIHQHGLELSETVTNEINEVKPLKTQYNTLKFVDPGHWTYNVGTVELDEEIVQDCSKSVPIQFQSGMKCPICRKNKKFQLLNDFSMHWLLSHIEFNERYECPHAGCSVLSASIHKLSTHYNIFHNDNKHLTLKMQKMLSTVKSKNVKNSNYVNPGDFTFDCSNVYKRRQKYYRR